MAHRNEYNNYTKVTTFRSLPCGKAPSLHLNKPKRSPYHIHLEYAVGARWIPKGAIQRLYTYTSATRLATISTRFPWLRSLGLSILCLGVVNPDGDSLC